MDLLISTIWNGISLGSLGVGILGIIGAY
jgi:hypothetical protein